MSKERLDNLYTNVACFIAHWLRKCSKDNPQYLKLHSLVCGLRKFAEKTGMCGLAAAQGFENKHNRMNQLSEILSGMVKTGDRVQKLQQRHMSFLIPGVDKRVKKVESSKNRRKSTSCIRTSSTRSDEDIEEMKEEEEDMMCQHPEWEKGSDGYLRIEDGGFIDDKWAEIYMYLRYKKNPEAFLKSVQENENIGTKAKQESKYQE
mmetsp:Transcript_12510/g.15413  ORF Transcript_12510/g.15413 Transcript_12510/m.15413 type:complete len:205 (+) Transcript_12510:238-852(+)